MSAEGFNQTTSSVADAPRFSASNVRQVVSCRVCGRTLLIGETSVGLFTEDGDGPYDVCELCVQGAHRYGLRARPSTAAEVANARRKRSIVNRITSKFAKQPRAKARPSTQPLPKGSAVHVDSIGPDGMPVPPPNRRGRILGALQRGSSTNNAKAQAQLGAVPVGAAAIPLALAAFNESSYARTLAGLHRTLGTPRASVTPRTTTDREVILTVAWDIVWYQFRIMPDAIEQESGSYIGELAERWQDWNCRVDSSGKVHELTGENPA